MTGSAREAVGNVLAREFHIVVQKPFKGAWTYKVEVTGSENRAADVRIHQKTNAGNEEVKSGQIGHDDSNDLLAGMDVLRGLPTHHERDIYGLDTILQFNSAVGEYRSNEQPVEARDAEEENKENFKKFVDEVESLARKHAKDAAI